MVHPRKELERARRAALAELVHNSHWITIAEAISLIPCGDYRLRKHLKDHPLSCPRCPVYRILVPGPPRKARVLSPRDIEELRDRLLYRWKGGHRASRG